MHIVNRYILNAWNGQDSMLYVEERDRSRYRDWIVGVGMPIIAVAFVESCCCFTASVKIQAWEGDQRPSPHAWKLNVIGKCSLQIQYSLVAFVLLETTKIVPRIISFIFQNKTKHTHIFLYAYTISERIYISLLNSRCYLIGAEKRDTFHFLIPQNSMQFDFLFRKSILLFKLYICF